MADEVSIWIYLLIYAGAWVLFMVLTAFMGTVSMLWGKWWK